MHLGSSLVWKNEAFGFKAFFTCQLIWFEFGAGLLYILVKALGSSLLLYSEVFEFNTNVIP